MPNTYISSDIKESLVSPFNSTINPVVLTITIDEYMTPMIKADADFQGISNFKISLTGDLNVVYSTDCRSEYTTCAETYHTESYFSNTDYIPTKYGGGNFTGIYGSVE